MTTQELPSKNQRPQASPAQPVQAIRIEDLVDKNKNKPVANEKMAEKPAEKVAEKEAKSESRPMRAAQNAAKPAPATHSAEKAKMPKESSKAPSMSQWLHNIAKDKGEARRASSTPTTEPSAESPAPAIIQAAAQMTNDKQRRAALNKLLEAASSQIDALFTEDKQANAAADAIERLQPSYQQLMLGMISQLEQIQPPAQSKTKLPAQDQLLQSLTAASPYLTVLNYLQAAIQLLKQADIADQTPLASRLQGLSDFDKNSVQMMTKRYQDQGTAKAEDNGRPADSADGK